ncbi:EscU/YscU/HrcU family type III secretion system export apparatus switch protein [Tropicimonas marinistellae]|uniref:EscU/YscU/HrcU family type III secretion system export apparatus switch protein n=1 Tax=Tropicimonas marinistellae TaxID=1739787 RepID=UPI0008319D42|nr:flagellar type III secretion system protein FlhB [Tropicimonas marinistellae]
MSTSDESEKQHEPTQKRLDDARRKGEIPRSNDLSTAVSYACFLLIAWIAGGWFCDRLGTLGVTVFRHIARVDSGTAAFTTDLSTLGFHSFLMTSMMPVLAVPGLGVLAALVARRGLVFAPTKLAFRMSRLSPIENAKNKFGRSGLFEFVKSSAKLLFVSAVLAVFLFHRAEQIAGTMWLEPMGVAAQMGRLALDFLGILVALLVVIGGLDLSWQVVEHRRRNRMSRKELQDETKDSEGDPHIKQQRRQRGHEIAMGSMLRDVPQSAVVIVNPEHYAVALKWDATFPGPPVCVAKGVDHVAAKIREAANEAGVPIHRDPPTARALHATVEVGEEIPPEQYRPVAAAIRFADKMKRLARSKVSE